MPDENSIETTVRQASILLRLYNDAANRRLCKEDGHPSFNDMHMCPRCGAVDPVYVATMWPADTDA